MTAIDWLVEQLKINNYISDNAHWLIDEAKEMEKQQIIDAMDVTQRTDFYVKYEGSEQYYNETFKNK
jgi:hypothetical protein